MDDWQETLRVCSACLALKPSLDFPSRGNRCLECRRAKIREHYAQNREYYIDKARTRRAATIKHVRQWIAAYLEDHPCVDCGETDIRVLEFDHQEPANKDRPVAVLARGGFSLHRVQTEIAKCQVRCANCHRRKTHVQRGWWGAEVPSNSARPERLELPAF